MNTKQVSDARRLAVLLDQYADDPTTVKKLAQVLHYDAKQLEVDMRTLYSYMREMESTLNEDDT